MSYVSAVPTAQPLIKSWIEVIPVPPSHKVIRIKYIKGYAQVKRDGEIIACRTPYKPFKPDKPVTPSP